MTKREARALAKARRAELDMQAVGCGMARTLFALPCWAAADTVLAFAAMPDEPDTAAILRQALADAAAKAFDATFDVDDSLVNEDESELPPELLTAPAVAD